jgi:hypothetical protein
MSDSDNDAADRHLGQQPKAFVFPRSRVSAPADRAEGLGHDWAPAEVRRAPWVLGGQISHRFCRTMLRAAHLRPSPHVLPAYATASVMSTIA